MKEHPRLTLGEDFAQEKSWQWQDITVLTARLTLPKTKGESRREKRFDRYYRALADAYFARCEQKLLPDAAKTCRAAMARSAPWQMTAVTLTYRVSAQTEDAVVFTFEVNDRGGEQRRWRCTGKGGISLFQKEISLPYTLPEKICIGSLDLEGVRRLRNDGACVAALLRSPPLALLYDLTSFYYPLPLCKSSVSAA